MLVPLLAEWTSYPYTGVRAQEACDLQLRDLDLRGGTLTVRSGKGRKVRRIPLHPTAMRLLERYLVDVRCPQGVPPLGADAERAPLLVRIDATTPGRPLIPGMTPRGLSTIIQRLGTTAAASLRARAAKVTDLQQLDALMTAGQAVPQLVGRHGVEPLGRRLLTQGAQLPEVQRILGHSRLSTTGMYLTPSEDELRGAIERMEI